MVAKTYIYQHYLHPGSTEVKKTVKKVKKVTKQTTDDDSNVTTTKTTQTNPSTVTEDENGCTVKFRKTKLKIN